MAWIYRVLKKVWIYSIFIFKNDLLFTMFHKKKKFLLLVTKAEILINACSRWTYNISWIAIDLNFTIAEAIGPTLILPLYF